MCWFHLKILDKTRSCSWRMERKLIIYGFLSPESPSKQKHISWIKFNQFKTSPFELPFLNFNVQNVYQINIFQSNQFMHKIKKEQKYSVYLPKIIWCTMPYLSHQLLLNKLPRTTNIPKTHTVFSISERSDSLEQLSIKKRKRNW